DRLVFIANDANVLLLLCQEAHQLILAAVRVLVLVNHQELEATVVLLAEAFVVRKQADGFEEEVVEIERIGLVKPGLVLVLNFRELRRLAIGRAAIGVLRRKLAALVVADPGTGGAVLHEFFVEAEGLENTLYECDLVVIVVD